MSTIPSGWIPLHSDSLAAEVDPQGAQLCVLRDAGHRDLLWNGDPTVWKGRAPILFPIVGALNGGEYRWQGRRYALSRHGFARDRRFSVLQHGDRKAVFRLATDQQTLAIYPFRFALDITYELENAALSVTATARNDGAVPMPASLGFHPALRWPLPYGDARSEHFIEFEHDEPAPIRRLDTNGLLTAALHPTPLRGRTLRLDDTLFADDVVIFEHLTSCSLVYGAANGPRIRVSFPDATYLGLWTKPGAGFICIEPWRGVADPAGFDGEFSAKPGVFTVAPGGSESLTMRIELLADR